MPLVEPEHIRADVLIIGAGLAGCRAAIAAIEAGARDVLVLAKGRFPVSGSSFYPLAHGVGFSASTPASVPGDSPEVHFQDILAAGAETCDHRLARILADEAPARLEDLLRFGIQLPNYQARRPSHSQGLCFNSHPRGDTPRMKELRRAFPAMLERLGVKVRDGLMVVALLGGPDGCRGALAMDQAGRPLVVHAAATILATGGASPVFRHFLDTPELTGDGYALALRLGATLTNIEFFQITWQVVHPAGGILPLEVNLYNNPAMMGRCPRFLNARGEEFFDRYLPAGLSLLECVNQRVWHGPFSTRLASKWFDIGIFSEVQAGRGTEHDGVWADFRGLTPEPIYKSDHYIVADRYRREVVDVWNEMAELTLFVHAFNGGVRIREDGQSTVPRLYACGEVSGGMHSADRLGGNAFASTQVFGYRAGVAAAARAAYDPAPSPDPAQVRAELTQIERRLTVGPGPRPAEVRGKIRDMMWRKAMICMTEQGLTECADVLAEIGERDLPAVSPASRGDIFAVLELPNLLLTAQLITDVSRERRESRGPHYRADHPEPDARYAGSYLIELAGEPAPGRPVEYTRRLVNLTEQE
jgi:succinate dehydrogenase/fumarate reductase flavoprotein subunit